MEQEYIIKTESEQKRRFRMMEGFPLLARGIFDTYLHSRIYGFSFNWWVKMKYNIFMFKLTRRRKYFDKVVILQ